MNRMQVYAQIGYVEAFLQGEPNFKMNAEINWIEKYDVRIL